MWIFEGEEIRSLKDIPERFQDSYGFVYNIVVSGKHKKTGKPFHGEYIGMKALGSRCKKYVSAKYLKENGKEGLNYVIKKGQRRYYYWDIKETNWVSYTGSSKKVNKDIADGAEITKYILEFCPDKTTLRYREHKNIICSNAMEEERFYNDYTQIKVFKKNVINKL